MSNFIDRRQNGKNKSSVNRRKFLKRVKEQVLDAVNEQIKKKKIKDAGTGGDVKVKRKTVSEPNFRHGPAGKKKGIHPGNKEFIRGDELNRPEGSPGSGTEGSPTGDSEDDFIFSITGDEFLEVFFDGLELPDLIKTSLLDIEETQWRKAGYTKEGSPANLNVEKSIEASIMRKLAMTAPYRERLKEVEEELEKGETEELLKEKEELIKKINSIPFIDDVDIRYNLHVKEPKPTTNAVMFCLMDVSGSMTEYEKDIAKKFFILLHLFLKRQYKKVDIVFLRHHHDAEEVDEETFFHGRESGGTIVSRVIDLMSKTIQERYPTSDWNIYAAQASDGDNWPNDGLKCLEFLENRILPYVQYFAYVEIEHDSKSTYYTEHDKESDLWKYYNSIIDSWPNMEMKKVESPADIWHVFSSLFRKKENQ